ncbi:hypothetical protein PRIPAC_84640, partial [Pristionchus pacificus]|uniref:Uncharacterized protein n=1 Tax=Pristionchus pacificus TaxID=54126 RepID=A0A2A6CCI4_PRIPA
SSLLRFYPLPSSHFDYFRPLGSRLEEGWQVFRDDLSIKSARYRDQYSSYPIKNKE